MQTRTRMTATAAMLFMCGSAWLSGRQGRPEQPPAFRAGTEVVSIDVGVVDRRGQPVRGLGPGDFKVTVGGQPRSVVSAEFVDLAPALTETAESSDAGVISTNEGAGVGRTILFIVDQNTLDLGAARQVARSSAHFFTGLTFADRSALALLPIGPNVQFTWAHARVRDALQRVVGTGGTRQTWEYGSLADARDIASTGTMALRTLGERECGGSTSAGAGAGGGGSGVGGGGAPA
ncbi:MAG: hypothetical protein M3Q85_15450, partial [Acidobacteriota bacterium]|nr:hypothetical protein [Acidobacteriota bacterium]